MSFFDIFWPSLAAHGVIALLLFAISYVVKQRNITQKTEELKTFLNDLEGIAKKAVTHIDGKPEARA